MLAPASQLLLRNLDRLPAGDLLLVNAPADTLAQALRARGDIHPVLFTQDAADARALAAAAVPVHCATEPPAGSFAAVIVFHPKERALADLLLFMARSRLAAGGSIWLLGENKGGIRNSEKRLAGAGIDARAIDTARHCRLVQVTPKTTGAAFRLDDWLEITALPVDAAETELLAVAALPGVFSAGRIDEGTALLLSTLGDVQAGRVLDMGCGAGVIGALLKKRRPALTVEMIDSNWLAVLASEETLKANGVTAKVTAGDGLAAASDRYDWIVSNPPFHAGLATDYRFVEQFIADAPRFLRPGGRLRLVANAHLKYLPLLEQHFRTVKTLAETTKFRVFEGREPR